MTKKKIYQYNDNPDNVNAYWSSKYLEDFTKTKSLKKLEEVASRGEETRLIIVSSAYVFYNKFNLLSKEKYPNLYDVVQLFKKYKDEIYDHNDYSKLNNTIYLKSKKRDFDNENKGRLLDYVKEQLLELDVPLKKVTDKTNIEYSNAYRALYKDKLSDISIEKITNIIEELERWKKY